MFQVSLPRIIFLTNTYLCFYWLCRCTSCLATFCEKGIKLSNSIFRYFNLPVYLGWRSFTIYLDIGSTKIIMNLGSVKNLTYILILCMLGKEPIRCYLRWYCWIKQYFLSIMEGHYFNIIAKYNFGTDRGNISLLGFFAQACSSNYSIRKSKIIFPNF